MAFTLINSNNLESLIRDNLIDNIRTQPLSDPFQSEIIIVQNQGMAVYLKQFIAKHNEICCNIDFPFINGFINETLEKCLDIPPDKEYFHPNLMTWNIWQLLDNEKEKYPDLKRYLDNDIHELKKYQLATKIASCFDQYQIYRPEEISNNLKNLSNYKWQESIWNQLSSNKKNRTIGFNEFQKIDKCNYLESLKRISIVGIFSMPPIFIEFFHHLSKFIDVNIYCIFPKNFGKNKNLFVNTLGNAGNEFIKLLKKNGAEIQTHLSEKSVTNLLSEFQDSLQYNNITKKSKISDESISTIQIHNCHSKMREVEVLRNNILHLIDKKNINPSDITVMMPDITEYSPYIKSVFERKDISANNTLSHIPYTITDNSISFSTPIDDIFLQLLNIHKTRFESSYVLSLLEKEVIFKKLRLNEEDIELCRKWIADTKICWGINGQQREKDFGLINFDENSWEKGLNRMFLGFCIKDDEYPKLHYGHLPYDQFEGHNNLILGKLSFFINFLKDIYRKFQKPMSITEWQKQLHNLIDNLFFDFDEYQNDLILLREKINQLAETTKSIDTGNISIDILHQYFAESLKDEFQTSRYFRGGITISTLQTLRNIPSKVICLIGMNDNAFPRSEHLNSFNILSNEKRIGDRVKREEDQYLFLEALISARDYLIISYTGQDIRTNEVSEPASTVCELMDYLKKMYSPEIINKIYFKHKLQGHNPIYFNPEFSSFFCYSRHNYQSQQTNKIYQFHDSEKMICNAPEITEIYIDDLIKSLENPARFFTEKVLRAQIKNYETEINDAEIFEIDNLEKYSINQYLIVGLSGKEVFNKLEKDINTFLNEQIEFCNNENLKNILKNCESKTVDFEFNNIRIFGQIPQIYYNKILHIKYSELKYFNGKVALKSWVYHLIASLCMNQPESYIIIKNKKAIHFPVLPINNAESELNKIIDFYKESHQQPLPFFPKTSYKYISKKNKLKETKESWNGTFRRNDKPIPGDKEDPYIRLFFSEKTLSTDRFKEIAQDLLSPFAKHFDKENDYLTEEISR